MGNAQSSNNLLSDKGKKELIEKVQDIAGSYASSLNFEDMTNLFDDEYCSKIEILTKDILDKNLNTVQLEYLAQHKQKGENVDFTKIDNTTYVKHGTNLKKNQQTRKNRLCTGLAKYFIKIFKIYAAITKTINPNFSDISSQEKIDLFNFYNINPNTYKKEEGQEHLNMKLTSFDNICDIRIEMLKSLYDEKLVANFEQPVAPPMEETQPPMEETQPPMEETQPPMEETQPPMEETQPPSQETAPTETPSTTEETQTSQQNTNKQQMGGAKEPAFCNYNGKNLNEEYGISELEDLFKDKFNFTTNSYEMSPQSESEYKNTLINMYKAFTGKNETPGPEIRSFSDVILTEYSQDKLCTTDVDDNDLKYEVNTFQRMFIKFANHLNKMISKTFSKYDSLLLILKQIFSFEFNEKTKKTVVRLNKNTNESTLDQLLKKTREIITQLYIDCQNDFIEGINIYKSIVYTNLLKRNKSRQINLQKQMQDII